jgi:voltage-gated potassium channel
MSIIDLLAILPYYRPLRLLRILMLFRLFKILRYTNSIKQFSYVFIEKRFEFFTLVILFLMSVTFGSTIIYIYEGAGVNPNIHSFFDAVYWSVITISTVGFGDISPVTIQGKVATIFLVIGGMGVIAFFTSIVTTSLHEKLEVIKEDKIIGEANSLNDFTIICGFGRMGQVVAKELYSVKQNIIIVDQDQEKINLANKEKYLSVLGDATDASLLLKIGLTNGAKNILALTQEDAINLSIILTARAHIPTINIIARANNYASKAKLKLAGANHVVFTNEIAAIVAAEYVGQPVAFNAIDDILLNNEGSAIDELEIHENSNFIDKTLSSISFSSYNLTLIGIIQENSKEFLFNPKKDQYKIQYKDILIVIGYKESIQELKIDLLSKKVIA